MAPVELKQLGTMHLHSLQPHTHTYTQLWKKQLRNFTHCETPGKFLWHKENELTVKEAKCLNRNHTSSHLNMQPFRHREAVNNSKEASSHSTSGAMYIPSSESAPFSKRRPRQYKPPLGAIRYSSNHTTCMPFPQRRGVGSSFLKGSKEHHELREPCVSKGKHYLLEP